MAIKILQQYTVFLILFTVCLTSFGLTTPVLADPPADGLGVKLQNPLCLEGGANGPNCTNDFPELIKKIKNFVVALISSLAVVALVWAGILFVTAGANPSNVEKAKKAALYAVIGIAVALAADGLITVITAVVSP